MSRSLRPELVKLYNAIQVRDPSVCGSAPEGIVETIGTRLNALLNDPASSNECDDIEQFVRGAVRYIDDQCGSDGDVLGNKLFGLISGPQS